MKNILIVDDYGVNRFDLATLLKRAGFDATTAGSGREALSLAKQTPPDAIISDLPMSRMDGSSLLREWRADPVLSSIPFVVYTATAKEPEDERLALDLGADAFILKPQETGVFLQRLSEVLTHPHAKTAAPPQAPPVEAALRDDPAALLHKLQQKCTQLEQANLRLLEEVRQCQDRATTEAAILDALAPEVALLDTRGVILDVNKAWRNFALANGYAQPSFGVGTNYLAVCDGAKGPYSAEAASVASAIRSVLEGDVPTGNVEYPFDCPAEKRWFRMTVTPLNTDHPSGAVVMHADITAKKRADDQRALLEQRLFQAEKMESIGRLAGGIAHDFNNILTVINGYSHMILAKLPANDPLQMPVSEINKAGEWAAALTRQLLAFSRKQILKPQALDLNAVVRNVQPMIAALLGESIAVTVVLAPGKAMVYADPHRLDQVMMNLAANARDAMSGGGQLRIETALLPVESGVDYVTLSFTDSGVGMDAETQKQIFEPFFTTKPVGQGTGLGLATVQGIVAQSDGHIEVHSEPGHGSTFTIYLPSLIEVTSKPEPAQATFSKPLSGNERILVVEDSPEVRQYAVAALKSYGYEVWEAATADDALALCASLQGSIDLVLSDVVMPNVNGWQWAKRLAEVRPTTKVLLMSGYVENELKAALEQGMHFIEKPFTPEELAKKIRTVLDAGRFARILVVDDESTIRAYLRKVLEAEGHDVFEADDGRHVLHLVRENTIDIVMTDLIMPDQEGLATIQQLHRQMPQVGIIAMSGAFDGHYLKVAQRLGAHSVLDKPINLTQLSATISQLLNKPKPPGE